MTHNTDHTVEGTKKIRAGGEGWIGGLGIRLEDLAYEGLGFIDPHMDGPISQPTWTWCCNIFHSISEAISSKVHVGPTKSETRAVRVYQSQKNCSPKRMKIFSVSFFVFT